MATPNQSLLRIPQGTERFSLSEAYRHRRLVTRIEDFYQRWGYSPVQTPVVDFYDAFDPLLSPVDRRNAYRLIDRDGEVLILRSDITLFLAKQMGLLLDDGDLPERVYYSDTILRHQDAHDISRNEFFQTGIELVGVPGTAGELEVVVLLLELLRHISAPQHVCHIGSYRLLEAIVGDAVAHSEAADPLVFESVLTRVRRAVILRRFDDVEAIIGKPLPAEHRALLESILAPETFLSRVPQLTKSLPANGKTAVEELSTLVLSLSELGYDDSVRVDFSEVGNQSYHSGTAFRCYIDSVDSAVAAGGRYDGLLRQFGCDAPSVGFSVMLRKIEAQIPSREERPQAAGPTSKDIVTRLRQGRDMVREGGRAAL